MRLTTLLLPLLLLIAGCAGIPLPFTEARLGRKFMESNRQETNSECIDLDALNATAEALDQQHLLFIHSKDESDALRGQKVLEAFGPECEERFVRLSIPQIKTELFGDTQNIENSKRLRELAGAVLDYRNVFTLSAFEVSLHLNQASQGPDWRVVVIYRLEDDVVIHFLPAGTNNVDRKSRTWPIDEFFRAAMGIGTSVGRRLVLP
jgi:hypothetical protein